MKKAFILGCILFSLNLLAQNDLATRLLIYPAGKITTIQFSTSNENGWAWTAEVGYNFARRQDFGLHDNEEGGGPGVGSGIRKYFSKSNSGIYAEVSSQIWFLQIEWRDDFICPPNVKCLPNKGTTNITVLQPTLGVGYELRSKSEKWAALLGIAFGREFNIRTKGEEVGQGGISLMTFSVSRRL